MKARTWSEFSAAEPELAAFGERRLAGRVAYLGTVRADGSPRVHPITPHLGDGRLFVYMEPTSPKVADLQRDGRFALHCSVEDTTGGEGEFTIAGRATLIEDAELRAQLFAIARREGFWPEDHYVVFDFAIDRVSSTVYEAGQPVRRRWRAV